MGSSRVLKVGDFRASPNRAWFEVTACNTKPALTVAPTWNALAGCPSKLMTAMALVLPAMATPNKLMRTAVGAAATGDDAGDALWLPKTLAMSAA